MGATRASADSAGGTPALPWRKPAACDKIFSLEIGSLPKQLRFQKRDARYPRDALADAD